MYDSDLFECESNLLPIEVVRILNDYSMKDSNYENCKRMLIEMEKIGYYFEFGLDAIPFNLHKIEIKN